MKNYFKYVNQYSIIFYALIFLQLLSGWDNGHFDWSSLWGAALVWGLFLLGYNSLDRELKIMLDKAREEMAKEQ